MTGSTLGIIVQLAIAFAVLSFIQVNIGIILIFLLFLLVSLVGKKQHWYKKYWWFDNIPHFLGGFALSFFTKQIFLALFIIIAWEFIEVQLAQKSDHHFEEELQDKIMDVLVGVAGFFAGLIFF